MYTQTDKKMKRQPSGHHEAFRLERKQQRVEISAVDCQHAV